LRGDSCQLSCSFSLVRPPEAFVSIQLEKLGPRDMMLNTFIHKKETLGSRMENPVSTSRGLAFLRETTDSWCIGKAVPLRLHYTYSELTYSELTLMRRYSAKAPF